VRKRPNSHSADWNLFFHGGIRRIPLADCAGNSTPARTSAPTIAKYRAPIVSSPRCIGPSCTSLVGETHATCGRLPPPLSHPGAHCASAMHNCRGGTWAQRGFHPGERARVFADASEIARFAHSKFVNVPRVRSLASMFAFNFPATGTHWGCERPGCTCSREEAQTFRAD